MVYNPTIRKLELQNSKDHKVKKNLGNDKLLKY